MKQRVNKRQEGEQKQRAPQEVIKANDDSVYYSGVYWNDYPEVSKEINRRISGNPKVDWQTHFIKTSKGRVFKKALILNCGNGWVERQLYDKGLFKEAVGVDYSEGLLKEARRGKKKRKLRYYQMDINTAQFPEEDFDLVVNNASGHHIAYIDKVLREISKVMTDDGVFVNFDYVGAHRNQYPLVQWLQATRVNRNLPEHLQQDMKYPHLPTMLVTDPSEAVHSELEIKTFRRYFKITEHKKFGGAIAYLLLTHNEKMQGGKKREVSKWTKIILEKDEEYIHVPKGSMFDYWVGVPKRRNGTFTKLRDAWNRKREELREQAAQDNGGVFYRWRPNTMQRYTIWQENRRLKRMQRNQLSLSEKGANLKSLLARAGKRSIYQNFHMLLLSSTESSVVKFARYSAVVLGVGFATIASLFFLGLYSSGSPNKASLLGILVGMLSGFVTGFILSFPAKVKRLISVHRHALVALLLCGLFFAYGAYTAIGGVNLSKERGVALTFDEISILPNGYFYQQNGQYFINPEHPPLVKDVAALPLATQTLTQPEPKDRSILLQDYAQYLWGKEFLFEMNNPTERVIALARISVLAANSFLIFVLYLSVAKAWSKRAGMLALILIAASQFTIAHAMLVTVDVMAALFTVISLVWLSVWLKQIHAKEKSLGSALLVSVFTAGALLSKFSTILLVPCILLVVGCYFILCWRSLKGRRVKFVLSIIGMLAVSLLFITLWYTWHVRNMSTADVVSQLNVSYPIDRYPAWGKTLLESIAGLGILGRAFAEFAHGLLMVSNRIYKGAFGVYFMQSLYGAEGAGPMYFIVLYFTKLQITFHLLSFAALIGGAWIIAKQGIRRSIEQVRDNPVVAVLAVYVILFSAISITSTLQIGLRHIFAVVFGISVLVAMGIDSSLRQLPKRYKKPAIASLAVSIIIMVLSVATSYPYFLSYYNVLGGGTDNGYKITADSNYDWGQDVKLLANWKRDNNVEYLYHDLFINPFLPTGYFFDSNAENYNFTDDGQIESGSIIAISAQRYLENIYKENLPEDQSYLRFGEPIDRIGTSIFIFRAP